MPVHAMPVVPAMHATPIMSTLHAMPVVPALYLGSAQPWSGPKTGVRPVESV